MTSIAISSLVLILASSAVSGQHQEAMFKRSCDMESFKEALMPNEDKSRCHSILDAMTLAERKVGGFIDMLGRKEGKRVH